MKYIISITISLIVLFNCYGQKKGYGIPGNRKVDTANSNIYFNNFYIYSETDSNNVIQFRWEIYNGDTTLYVGDSLATIKYLLNQLSVLQKGNKDKEMVYDGINFEPNEHKVYNNNPNIAKETTTGINKIHIGARASTSNGTIGDNSFTLANNYSKTDTIPCIMLLCDTSVHVGYSGYFSGDGVAENMAPHNFYNSYMYWLFGYRISSGLGKCLKYIDNEYKPLPCNHMVWISIKTENK